MTITAFNLSTAAPLILLSECRQLSRFGERPDGRRRIANKEQPFSIYTVPVHKAA